MDTESEQKSDLLTVAGVLQYLASTAFASDEVHPLSGGYSNFVYRIHLRTPYNDVSTMVLKHATPYVAASDKTMPYAVERQNFEVAAMRSAKAILPTDTVFTVPTIHHFDDVAHVVIMDDCGAGAPTLKQLMLENPPPLSVASAIGAGLGDLLGRVHTWGRDPQTSNHTFFDTNQQGKMVSAFVTYGRLISTLTDKDDVPALSDPPLDIAQSKLDIISTLSSEKIHAIHTSHQTLTMGDFWPGNIMVCPSPANNGSPSSLERVYVLDWELAKPGLAGLDVGQFCAEMHLLRRFSPACDKSVATALNAFLQSYRNSFEVDIEIAKDAVTHIGAHLVAWTPRVPWGDKERTREVVVEGVEYLVGGYAATPEWLGELHVGPLL